MPPLSNFEDSFATLLADIKLSAVMMIQVLSSKADVSSKLFPVLRACLRLPLPPHCDCDFKNISSTGAGSTLVILVDFGVKCFRNFGVFVQFLEEIFRFLYQYYGSSSRRLPHMFRIESCAKQQV